MVGQCGGCGASVTVGNAFHVPSENAELESLRAQVASLRAQLGDQAPATEPEPESQQQDPPTETQQQIDPELDPEQHPEPETPVEPLAPAVEQTGIFTNENDEQV